MNRKILTLLAIFLVAVSIASVCAVELTKENDFDGKFKMNIQDSDSVSELKDSLEDSQNGGNTYLSNASWKVNDNISVFFYEKAIDSVLSELKSNSGFMDDPKTDGNLTILEDTAVSEVGLKYFVGVSSGDKTVFIGSNDLDAAKEYAKTISF